MHVVDMIYHWARIDPHRSAIVLPELVTTFGGLAEAIDSISNRIDQLGLDPREPVATAIANPALALAVLFALQASGFGVVPADRGLIKHLQPNGIKNLIYDVEGFVASGGRNIRFDKSWLPATSPISVSRPFRRRSVGNADVIFLEPGESGLPRTIVQSSGALEERMALRSTAHLVRTSVLIVPRPASAFGFSRTCELLHFGKTVCFAPTPEAMLALIGLFQIDTLVGLPRQVSELATLKESKPELPVDSLCSIILSSSTSIGGEGIRRIQALLCRSVFNEYAPAEGGLAAYAPLDRIEGIAGAVGFVAPWVEVEVVDDAGCSVPAGRDGVIRYRTERPSFSAADFENDAVTDQWFYPGDRGHLTDAGVLCLARRPISPESVA
jgi:acyl-CoA synthetase (AMP-forming)/AMP-acid ligase II